MKVLFESVELIRLPGRGRLMTAWFEGSQKDFETSREQIESAFKPGDTILWLCTVDGATHFDVLDVSKKAGPVPTPGILFSSLQGTHFENLNARMRRLEQIIDKMVELNDTLPGESPPDAPN